MNTAGFVDAEIARMESVGMPLSDVAWQAALLCVGWAYVFGARGQYCTPANRRARYSDEHPTIKTKCRNFDGTGSCSACQWLPGGEKTRFFDCRGFTYWILKQVYGWELMGAGATSQWNTETNWAAKGTIADGVPADTLVCLFKANGKTMEHTGFGFNQETVECSSGVQHFTTRNKKWTHWGVPACVGGSIPEPVKPDPQPDPAPAPAGKPTIRRGSKGQFVTLAQTLLINRGYQLPRFGADGDFGSETDKAVRQFQRDWGLAEDGVIGPKTWSMLESTPAKTKSYRVTIGGLDLTAAKALTNDWPGATMSEE